MRPGAAAWELGERGGVGRKEAGGKVMAAARVRWAMGERGQVAS
jgi:hypothetical protein